MCREVLKDTTVETDVALNYRISELCIIIREVGPERFQAAVLRCLRIYSRPWDISIHHMRQECGLDCTPAPSAATQAWALVTDVVKHHLGRNADGHVVLEPRVRLVDGETMVTPVPEIPEAVQVAVGSLGGWESMWQAYSGFWGVRMQQFEKVYRP